MKSIDYIVGIDEVGRGPVAGPVSVGAFCVPVKFLKEILPDDLRESKKLSKKKREEWFEIFETARKGGKANFVVASTESKTIDDHGIIFSLKHALSRAIRELKLNPKVTKVFLDGGLKAPQEFKYQTTIIRGDTKMPVIAAASIVAKVVRDRRMKKLGEQFPEYGFECHKGYGTQAHMEAIKTCGLCLEHRKTFLKNFPRGSTSVNRG